VQVGLGDNHNHSNEINNYDNNDNYDNYDNNDNTYDGDNDTVNYYNYINYNSDDVDNSHDMDDSDLPKGQGSSVTTLISQLLDKDHPSFFLELDSNTWVMQDIQPAPGSHQIVTWKGGREGGITDEAEPTNCLQCMGERVAGVAEPTRTLLCVGERVADVVELTRGLMAVSCREAW
jgi:hypothetical protein